MGFNSFPWRLLLFPGYHHGHGRAVPSHLLSRGSQCWLMDWQCWQRLCPMAWLCPWQHGAGSRWGGTALLSWKNTAQGMHPVLPSLGALPRPPGPARTDGSRHLVESGWELKQSRIPNSDKGLEGESLEAAASGVTSPWMFITK